MRKINGRGGIKESESLCENTIFLSVTLEREEESLGWRTKEDIALLRKAEGGIRQVWVYYCTFTFSYCLTAGLIARICIVSGLLPGASSWMA